MLHRCSRDDESVELLVPHLLEVAIEGPHVFDGRVLACVCLDLHQVYFKLKGAVGEQPDEVGLCGDFQRHEVEDGNAQRTDILSVSPFVTKDENVLFSEEFDGRQPVW